MNPVSKPNWDIKFNADVVVKKPPEFTPFFFVHVPKTGGQSIVTEIGRQIGQENMHGRYGHVSGSSVIVDYGRERWDTLFSFSVVRNPYDRLLSLYNFCMQIHKDPNFTPSNMPFETWVKYVLIDKTQQVMRIYNHIRPMTEWVYSLGELVVGHIGRFEMLQESWEEIAKKLNLEVTKLPHVNASKHEQYVVEYEKSPELIDIVGKFYEEDLKTFGYSFGS